MWTDGRTHMTKLIVDFRNFANAPKKPLPLTRFEEFPAVFIHARDQYIKQSFQTNIVLPDDGTLRPETCKSLWFL